MMLFIVRRLTGVVQVVVVDAVELAAFEAY